MNDLKKFAGLLNDEAPENHFLAYITPSERDMLVDAGGVKTPTPSGIFAYPPSDYYGETHSNKAQRTTTNTPSSNNNNNNNNNNDDPIPSQPPVTFNNNQPNPNIEFEGVSSDLSPYETGMVYDEDEYLAPDIDHYKATQKAIKSTISDLDDRGLNLSDYDDLTKEQQEIYQTEMNKLKGTEGVNYSFYAGNEGTINLSFNENFKDTLATNPGLPPTLRFLVAAGRTLKENLTTDYGTGRYGGYTGDGMGSGQPIDKGGWLGRIFNSDGTVNENLTESETNDLYNQAQAELPFIIGDTTPQESMVNKYFDNLGNNLGMSSAYLTTYNDAKNKIAQTLNLTPNTQQFGFGNTFNNNYARSMTSANPFFEELTDQGLI